MLPMYGSCATRPDSRQVAKEHSWHETVEAMCSEGPLSSAIILEAELPLTAPKRTSDSSTSDSSTIDHRLGFLEAFRTFWVSPQPELRVLIDKVEVLDSVFG